ncbi:alcohol oxidase-like protein [Nemania abortiva]|nr:alcohol oxidase-like protein [Nemania abortiva]
MGTFVTFPTDIEEVDVIIAGGGVTGCVVASRLIEAEPSLSVLVIESGRDTYNEPSVIHPALWRTNYTPDNLRVFFHEAIEEEQLANRKSIVQVGNTLGGGSSINLLMYMRPQRCDYDSWNTKTWTADGLLPYLKKFETYHGPGKAEHHGFNGPVHVSSGNFRSKEAEDSFLEAMNQVGIPEVEDLQDFDSIGVTRLLKYVSPEGKRQDIAHAYLHPKLQNVKYRGLRVLVETEVVRVLFDDRRASGVEFRPNPTFQTNKDPKTTRTVKAKRLVVLSCGTLGTPPVLERSGVGDPTILERAGVPLVANVPGIGNHYQDHNVCIYTYKSSLPPESTFDGIHTGQVDIGSLLTNKDSILGWNGIDASSKIRPTASEVDALGVDFKNAWDKDFKNQPSKPLVSMIFATGLLGNRTNVPPGQYFSLAVFTTYPYSRGHMHITGPNIDDRPEFKTGYLSDQHDIDLKTQLWAYKKQREVVQRMSIHRGEISHRHPSFDADSAASYAVTDPKDVTYSAKDDAAIETWIRQNLTTCWHGLGTCKMAPLEDMGVVDESLGVYGVHGLKIADLSVIPQNVCSNTMNTALLVGEKAADIFARDLSLVQ